MTNSKELSPTSRRFRSTTAVVASMAIGVVGGEVLAHAFAEKAPVSTVRATAAQEAMYYSEAARSAQVFEEQIRAGKPVVIPFLRGKITDKASVKGTAREYGPIENPIFLTPGPDSKNGASYDDASLDGGFVGVQSLSADNQIQISVVPFNKDTMDFTPSTVPKIGVFASVPVTAKTLHGSVNGLYAVAEEQIPGEPLTIPGYAPEQS